MIKWLKELSWKHILGEILLIFMGITLAIWFNNWNASVRLNKNKKIILAKIKEEIKSNLNELQIASDINGQILAAFNEYQEFYGSTTSEILSTPMQFHDLQAKYPGFFRIADSTSMEDNKYLYSGSTYVVLELPELTQIAWETARTINIAHEIEYDCLFELASTYSLQDRVQTELNKAAEALQKANLKELMSILRFLKQLDDELKEAYASASLRIESCN